MKEEKIKRINELYRKSKLPEGLTDEEKLEQKQLRAEYILAIKNDLTGTLNNIKIKEPDGTIRKLGKRQS